MPKARTLSVVVLLPFSLSLTVSLSHTHTHWREERDGRGHLRGVQPSMQPSTTGN